MEAFIINFLSMFAAGLYSTDSTFNISEMTALVSILLPMVTSETMRCYLVLYKFNKLMKRASTSIPREIVESIARGIDFDKACNIATQHFILGCDAISRKILLSSTDTLISAVESYAMTGQGVLDYDSLFQMVRQTVGLNLEPSANLMSLCMQLAEDVSNNRRSHIAQTRNEIRQCLNEKNINNHLPYIGMDASVYAEWLVDL
nr:23kDa-protein [Grapevine leafroll-associated virus 13]